MDDYNHILRFHTKFDLQDGILAVERVKITQKLMFSGFFLLCTRFIFQMLIPLGLLKGKTRVGPINNIWHLGEVSRYPPRVTLLAYRAQNTSKWHKNGKFPLIFIKHGKSWF